MNTKDDIISVFFKCQISVQNGRQPTTSHPKSPLTIMMPTPHFCHACSVSAVSLGSYNFTGFSLPLTCPSVSALSLCNPYCNRLNGSCLLIPKKRLEVVEATAVAAAEAARRLMIKCSAPSSLAPFAWL